MTSAPQYDSTISCPGTKKSTLFTQLRPKALPLPILQKLSYRHRNPLYPIFMAILV